jgi:hypothetical protein
VRVNAGRGQVHYNGVLAGLGAATAAVLLIPVLVFAVWRHVAGQMSAAVQVIVWTFTIAFVALSAIGLVFAVVWVRHRILNPETLARATVRAEVLAPPAPAAREIPAAAVAGLPAGPLWRINPRATPEPAEKEPS